jgi:starch phosphorylase
MPTPRLSRNPHFAQTLPPFKFNMEMTATGIQESILNHLKYTLGCDPKHARKRDWWLCTAMAVRDRVLDRYLLTQETHEQAQAKRLYYLSLEYLMGRLLDNNIRNADLLGAVSLALQKLGVDYNSLCDEEVDMGLGNGGLGRLAACFLDSLATLDYPAIGYGIRYEFGLFQQEFQNGHQVEHPDNWLRFGNPWQIVRPEYAVPLQLYGRIQDHYDDRGDWHPRWVDTKTVLGVPWDIPIVGHQCRTVNFLRLWESRSSHEFDFHTFNDGGYIEAVREKALSETISKVLYPNDKTENGKELRLVQQYFFVACSLHDILERHKKAYRNPWENFDQKNAIQLNDTHPAIAIAELMRLLLDRERLSWATAWGFCQKVFGYTNHTLLPEALERWSVPLFRKVLPRHLQIIFEINQRFLQNEVELKWPGDSGKKVALSIIEESQPQMVRMAHLAVVGSHSVNGVAALHTQLLKKHLFQDFDCLYPNKFTNKTNGITPRRWLMGCNPKLSELLNETIGTDWQMDLKHLKRLEPYAEDKSFQERFLSIKKANKVALAKHIQNLCHVTVDPEAIFDVQIKRLHEYKRQHLNLLHILSLYHQLLHEPSLDMVPRVCIFAAKAAPGYELAKTIIRAINCVAHKINNDSRIGGKLKVAFLPNYGVTLAEHIIPAADLSEQISTAGKEASGTGNMKLALNGALTIGTLDGANVEIQEAVGKDNIFIFGLTVEEVEALLQKGYNPYDYYNNNPQLKQCLDWLSSDYFTPHEPGALNAIHQSLLEKGDPFLVMADFDAYIKTQKEVEKVYKNRSLWAKKAILNTTHMGYFSSDRTIQEYAEGIWHLQPVSVPSGD